MSGGECSCKQQNPANLATLDESAGPPARVAQAEVCDSRSCETVHLLVRGDRVSFVSLERARDVGEKKVAVEPGMAAWRDRNGNFIPADITMPGGYVLVNDATSRVLDKCDIYVVKWRNSGNRNPQEIDPTDLSAAEEYFRTGAQIRSGFVEHPKGPWYRTARIRYIRYERHGSDRPFEHRYDVPVELRYCKRPLAWRLPLPEGCIIDSRGFVRP